MSQAPGAAPMGPMGWCPSVLRPMALSDGLMVRIRPWMGALQPDQAAGLADLAARYGAGVIELTNRANIQVRGLSAADHAALVPALDRLGLSRVDRTPSARVNVTVDPFRAPGGGIDRLARALSTELSAARWAALPEKFGFAVDAGRIRRLGGITGDIRIEAVGESLVVRAAGQQTGRRVADADAALAAALELADWFIGSGAIGPDGRGRMAEALDHGHRPPDSLLGDAEPNPAETPFLEGPAYVLAPGGVLSPDTLSHAATDGPLRLTPYRALFRPQAPAASHLVSEEASWNNPRKAAAG